MSFEVPLESRWPDLFPNTVYSVCTWNIDSSADHTKQYPKVWSLLELGKENATEQLHYWSWDQMFLQIKIFYFLVSSKIQSIWIWFQTPLERDWPTTHILLWPLCFQQRLLFRLLCLALASLPTNNWQSCLLDQLQLHWKHHLSGITILLQTRQANLNIFSLVQALWCLSILELLAGSRNCSATMSGLSLQVTGNMASSH